MNAKCRTEDEGFLYRFEDVDEPVGNGPLREDNRATLETITNYNKTVGGEPKFWRRQFGKTVTASQREFDWYFGFLLPLACIYFDPFVFTSWHDGDGFFAAYQPFAYTLSAASIMALAAWMLFGERLRGLAAPLAGIFFVASGVALIIGVMLLPFSLLGLVALIGMLGFTPLMTSLVFARNAVRALRFSGSLFDRRTLVYVAILSGLIGLALPLVINQQIKWANASVLRTTDIERWGIDMNQTERK